MACNCDYILGQSAADFEKELLVYIEGTTCFRDFMTSTLQLITPDADNLPGGNVKTVCEHFIAVSQKVLADPDWLIFANEICPHALASPYLQFTAVVADHETLFNALVTASQVISQHTTSEVTQPTQLAMLGRLCAFVAQAITAYTTYRATESCNTNPRALLQAYTDRITSFRVLMTDTLRFIATDWKGLPRGRVNTATNLLIAVSHPVLSNPSWFSFVQRWPTAPQRWYYNIESKAAVTTACTDTREETRRNERDTNGDQ
jgi:hypothetical protein